MLSIHTILCPSDFSENSKPAFQLACALARDYDAELHILHVARLPVIYGEGMVVIPTKETKEELIDKLKELQASQPNLRLEYHLREGEPFLEILDLAKRINCDLIVMGTHGRTGLTRVLMGSVAEQVLRKANCPVLTMKAKSAVGGGESRSEKKSTESVYAVCSQ